MALQWNQGLAVGNKEIDGQHMELFDRVNKFLDAMNQRKGREEVGEVIKFLEKYVVEHFGMEEKYMARYDYPGLLTHKNEHKQFIDAFNDIKAKFYEKGAGLDVVIQTQSKLGDWLRNHIPTVDKKLAVFLSARKAA